MKSRFFLAIVLTLACWRAEPVFAEYRAGSNHYRAIHIKQMANRNFINNGRSKYVYVVPQGNRYNSRSLESGAVQLGKYSRIRELNIAVDFKRSGHLPRRDENREISIGRVSGVGACLKKINIFINSNGSLTY